MKRKDDTLRCTLLDLARNIADIEGIQAINIRSIAKKSGVATGTVYNYFSNKDEIILALTEEYWKQVLLEMNTAITADTFFEQLEEIFVFLKDQINQSAGKLMSSLGSLETIGQIRMISVQKSLETFLISLINQDTKIRNDIWNENFTKEQLARFIMRNLIMLLKTKEPDFAFFIVIVKGIIY